MQNLFLQNLFLPISKPNPIQFCGTNFCDQQKRITFAELILANLSKIVKINYVKINSVIINYVKIHYFRVSIHFKEIYEEPKVSE